jgi:hypothetical protein
LHIDNFELAKVALSHDAFWLSIGVFGVGIGTAEMAVTAVREGGAYNVPANVFYYRSLDGKFTVYNDVPLTGAIVSGVGHGITVSYQDRANPMPVTIHRGDREVVE